MNHSGFGLEKNGENEEGPGIDLTVSSIANDDKVVEDNGGS